MSWKRFTSENIEHVVAYKATSGIGAVWFLSGKLVMNFLKLADLPTII
jgi:hypothetical protein